MNASACSRVRATYSALKVEAQSSRLASVQARRRRTPSPRSLRRHPPDAGELIARDVGGDVAPLDGLVQERQHLGTQERRREELVLTRDLDPELARWMTAPASTTNLVIVARYRDHHDRAVSTSSDVRELPGQEARGDFRDRKEPT